MKKLSCLTVYLLLTLTLISCRNNTPTPTPSPGNQIDSATPTPSPGNQIDSTLIDTQWRLTELNGEPYPTHIPGTMEFTDNGVEGDIGCNYWGNAEDVTIVNGVFNIPLIRKTVAGCEYNNLEKEFTQALAAQHYQLNGSQLLIQDESANIIMVFTPIK